MGTNIWELALLFHWNNAKNSEKKLWYILFLRYFLTFSAQKIAKTTAHKRTILNIKKQVEVDLELSILVKNLNSISWPSPFKM